MGNVGGLILKGTYEQSLRSAYKQKYFDRTAISSFSFLVWMNTALLLGSYKVKEIVAEKELVIQHRYRSLQLMQDEKQERKAQKSPETGRTQ